MIRLYKTTLSTGYNLSLYFQVHHTAKEGGEKSWDTLVNVSKIIFTVNMIIGRLELVPFLILLNKDYWSIKR